MTSRFDRFNDQISSLQADESPRPDQLRRAENKGNYDGAAEEVAILRMAAALNSLRPSAGKPDPNFVARLRARVLSEV